MLSKTKKERQPGKKRYFPSSFLIIVGIMLLFVIGSWIGQAVTNDITGIGFLDVFTSIWKGFTNKAEVILFIFSIGGTLGVMTRLKVIDAGITALVNKLKDKVWLLIPMLMVLFGLGGTTYGMWEETIAFIPVLIPVFKKAGYGAFTAILVILIGSGVGCLASTVNPFSVGAAVEGVVDKGNGAWPTMTTGTLQGTRWVSFIVFEIISIPMVMWVAGRMRKANVAGYTTEKAAIAAANGNFLTKFFTRGRVVEGLNNKIIDERFKTSEDLKFTVKKKISLLLFILAFVLMVIMYLPWGTILGNGIATARNNYNHSMWWFASTKSSGFASIGNWYFVSVAAIFLLTTIIIFAINFKSFKTKEENAEEGFISSYMDGVKDVVSVCLLIAVAGGLSVILAATGFDKLIAKNAANGLTNWVAFGIGIFLISIILSLFIPSTSGFAAAFMPIFAAIAVKAFPGHETTAIGLAMMGFLFASGIVNLFTPTSAALMGYTAYAGVPYNVWIKHTWKITLTLFVVAFVLILAFSLAAQGGSSLF
ncbi:MAG: YfcC family protein [Mycoplasmataceae bacterium]|nr:YfcC family protein [Mycoplasmataceae bacterium]